MSNSEVMIGRHYDALARTRGEPGNCLIPSDHLVNWGDKPYRFKIYERGTRIHLTLPKRPIQGITSSEPEKWSAMLSLVGAPMRRRMSINWNDPCTVSIRHGSQSLARGPASGGGLYPTEFYICVGSKTCFRPGIYHYDGAHHSLILLSPGNFTAKISAALNTPSNRDAYLFIAVDFWKSTFKYHNFAYQVCSQDAGAALAMATYAAMYSGIQLDPYFCFADENINRIAGLDTANESVFVVAGMTLWPDRSRQASGPGDVGEGPNAQTNNVTSLFPDRRTPLPRQRSKRVEIPRELQAVHRASLLDSTEVQSSFQQQTDRVGSAQNLHPLLDLNLLTKRHSSWGSMRSSPPTESACVRRLLSAVWSDIERVETPNGPVFDKGGLRLAVYANHLRGLERGFYDYSWTTSCLSRRMDLSCPASPLQTLYNLQNYNLDQIACFVFVVGNVDLFLDGYGNRGIRTMNIQAGLVVQFAYIEAVRFGLECGAVLGVKVRTLNASLQLQPSETVLVGILLGQGRNELSLVDMSFRNELWA